LGGGTIGDWRAKVSNNGKEGGGEEELRMYWEYWEYWKYWKYWK
jgi:hypothetical protein